ncbi:HepT-like ribonuclease domain-containing protein [Parabacteroides sp. PF5-6]|uniref:HepT-like ribonuclease domain-containing protein n=1 Tax=Parabacteroides sp. PF5-6 TaxID=1742403 RepID=UPI0024064AE8|nr:HepT-like ribonuclease domain-containing protein [Parabacteroides sp. PF5-6]MDF9830428.1 uncharacterized protein with HEPN domain [Parabacteroides sp. PF5-6]
MFDKELLIPLLEKLEYAINRILMHAPEITSPDYYLKSLPGMERLESTCLLLITIGESVKSIDKITAKEWLKDYPETDWKGVMGMRDIIAHHYFDIDAETIFDVVKNHLPALLQTIHRMKIDLSEKSRG